MTTIKIIEARNKKYNGTILNLGTPEQEYTQFGWLKQIFPNIEFNRKMYSVSLSKEVGSNRCSVTLRMVFGYGILQFDLVEVIN